MTEKRGRVQLIFRLDDPAEKAAFDILQAAPYRGKAAFVTKYILDRENENKMAERIAAKIVEILSRQPSAVIQPPKRKRGRPPKQPQIPLVSETPVESSHPVSQTARSEPKKKSIPALYTKPESSMPPVETRTPKEPVSPSSLEHTTPEPAMEHEDIMLDDAILQSMESFIAGGFL